MSRKVCQPEAERHRQPSNREREPCTRVATVRRVRDRTLRAGAPPCDDDGLMTVGYMDIYSTHEVPVYRLTSVPGLSSARVLYILWLGATVGRYYTIRLAVLTAVSRIIEPRARLNRYRRYVHR